VSDGRFVTYGIHEGLPDAVVTAVAAARGGGAWLGTDSAQVVRLMPDGRRTTYALRAGPGPEAVTALLETREGALFSVLATGRVFRLLGGVVSEQTPLLGKSARERTSGFFEDEDGIGLLVARRGLVRVRGGHAISLLRDGPGLEWPHTTHRDARGVLWLGTSVGLAAVHDGAFTLYGPAHGLPHARVRWISEDPDGSLWLATADGLARFEKGRFETLGVTQGLPEEFLRVVLDDGLGYLWIAGLGSLFRLDKNEVREVLAKRRSRVTPLVFDTSDGLRTTEARITNSPAFRADDGRLWFATTKGASVVDPRQVSTTRPAAPVTIESLTVDRREGGRQGAEVFEPGRGEVAIEYAAQAFVSPHKIRFRYRLTGLDSAWVDAGTRRQAYYGALPPGSYRFEVMASNPDGRWNGTPAAIAFSIRPPFAKTPAFYLLCAAALGLTLFAAYRLRVRRMRARFEVVLAERTRIAREMHDTLAQGVAGVGLQIETAMKVLDREPTAVRTHLRLAHAMARSSLEEVRRSIWVLRAQAVPEPGDLGQTLRRSLGALAAAHETRITVEVLGTPRPLDAATTRTVLRIAHEAVGNALRHAQAATVAVVLEAVPGAIALHVRDNGRGFDLEGQRARQGREHFGLLGIEERVRVLGGSLHIESAPGAGTEIVCRIPSDARARGAESVTEEGP
jgi:signal transduction histidine kinase